MDTCQSNVTATTAVTFCRFMPMRQPAKLQSHTSRYQRKRKWLRESYAWWWGHCGGWDVLVQLSNLLTSQWHNMPMTSDILRTNCRRRLARPNKQCEHHLTLVNSTLWLVFVDLKKTSDSFLFSLHLTLMVSTNQRDYWKSNKKKKKNSPKIPLKCLFLLTKTNEIWQNRIRSSQINLIASREWGGQVRSVKYQHTNTALVICLSVCLIGSWVSDSGQWCHYRAWY